MFVSPICSKKVCWVVTWSRHSSPLDSRTPPKVPASWRWNNGSLASQWGLGGKVMPKHRERFFINGVPNWVIKYHLPPSNGTRKLHWFEGAVFDFPQLKHRKHVFLVPNPWIFTGPRCAREQGTCWSFWSKSLSLGMERLPGWNHRVAVLSTLEPKRYLISWEESCICCRYLNGSGYN